MLRPLPPSGGHGEFIWSSVVIIHVRQRLQRLVSWQLAIFCFRPSAPNWPCGSGYCVLFWVNARCIQQANYEVCVGFGFWIFVSKFWPSKASCRSSIGLQRGFFGAHTLAFAVMICIIRKTRPVLFLHECTRTFAHSVLELLLPMYQLHHAMLKPADFGCPASRSRNYCCLVLEGYTLDHGFEEFYRLMTLAGPNLDCGAFMIAPEEEAPRPRKDVFWTVCVAEPCIWPGMFPTQF